MIKLKTLIKSILIPLLAGFVGYLLSGGTEIYSSINKPSFAPPSLIFPIVWTILYILMGISFYIIINSQNKENKEKAVVIYFIQLALNIIWPLIFFKFNLFFIAFLWVLLLLGFVIYMTYLFYKINPKAAYLQIPYILWLSFASILSYAVFTMQ